MRPRARDKKLHEEWATPLKSIDDIQEVKFLVWNLFSLFSFKRIGFNYDMVLLELVFIRNLKIIAWVNWEVVLGQNWMGFSQRQKSYTNSWEGSIWRVSLPSIANQLSMGSDLILHLLVSTSIWLMFSFMYPLIWMNKMILLYLNTAIWFCLIFELIVRDICFIWKIWVSQLKGNWFMNLLCIESADILKN